MVWLKLSPAGHGGMQSRRSYDQCRWLTLPLTWDNTELSMPGMAGKQLRHKVLKRAKCREEDEV